MHKVKCFSVDLQRVLHDSSEAIGRIVEYFVASINEEMNRWNQIIVPVFFYFRQMCFLGLIFHSHSSGKDSTSEFRFDFQCF